MQVSRRGFLKISAAGISGLAAVQLGIDLTPIKAYAAATKLEGSKEAISICPFCSCGCNVLVHSKDGKIINVEGDPDFPISDGGLCAKGASLKSLHLSPERLTKPLYRAPYSDKWEEKDWGWMMERIAQRIKEQRDKDFKVKNAQGQTVNRVESLFQRRSRGIAPDGPGAGHRAF